MKKVLSYNSLDLENKRLREKDHSFKQNINMSVIKVIRNIPNIINKNLKDVFLTLYAINYKKIYPILLRFFQCIRNNVAKLYWTEDNCYIKEVYVEKGLSKISLRIKGKGKFSRNKIYMGRVVVKTELKENI